MVQKFPCTLNLIVIPWLSFEGDKTAEKIEFS